MKEHVSGHHASRENFLSGGRNKKGKDILIEFNTFFEHCARYRALTNKTDPSFMELTLQKVVTNFLI